MYPAERGFEGSQLGSQRARRWATQKRKRRIRVKVDHVSVAAWCGGRLIGRCGCARRGNRKGRLADQTSDLIIPGLHHFMRTRLRTDEVDNFNSRLLSPMRHHNSTQLLACALHSRAPMTPCALLLGKGWEGGPSRRGDGPANPQRKV